MTFHTHLLHPTASLCLHFFFCVFPVSEREGEIYAVPRESWQPSNPLRRQHIHWSQQMETCQVTTATAGQWGGSVCVRTGCRSIRVELCGLESFKKRRKAFILLLRTWKWDSVIQIKLYCCLWTCLRKPSVWGGQNHARLINSVYISMMYHTFHDEFRFL